MGNGLNPLLQYWTMVIHPPMLYLGYVGFAVPFAFAMASLITKQPGDAWIHTTRRWTLVTWLFQSTGILLGAGWAYAVLGWGGYWAWDPVENASLLPWLTATAFLHSVMMQEKKGMMKVWNMVLVSATFFLCIFGTFLTRSRHRQFGARVRAVADRKILRDVPGDRHRGHGLSDSGPAGLSEERSATGKRGVARIQLPVQQPDPAGQLLRGAVGHAVPGDLGSRHGRKDQPGCAVLQPRDDSDRLFLLFLTGVGPLFAWRQKLARKSAARVPVAGDRGAGRGGGAGRIWAYEHLYALISFGLCMFVTVTIVIEFFKGASAIRAKNGIELIPAR